MMITKKTSLFLFLALLFVACNLSIEERIIDSYPNGVPTKVEYRKKSGNKDLVKHVRFYQSGEKQEEGRFENNLQHGKWIYWYENGQKWSEGFFFEGDRDGKSSVWYENGNLHYTGGYNKGKTDGEWKFYDSQGKLIKIVVFENGKKLNEESFEKEIEGFPAR